MIIMIGYYSPIIFLPFLYQLSIMQYGFCRDPGSMSLLKRKDIKVIIYIFIYQ